MPLLSFLKRKKDTEASNFLALDLNSHEVKCLTFQVAPEDPSVAKVVGTGTFPLKLESLRSGEIQDLSLAVEAADFSIKKATADIEDTISDIIIGVKGLACIEFMTTARLRRSDPVPIEKRELDEVFDRVIMAACERAQSEYYRIKGAANVELDLIDSAVVYTKVDGKVLKDPVAASGSVLEMAVFTSFTPGEVVKSYKSLGKKLGARSVQIKSQVNSFMEILSYSDFENSNYLIINLDDDFTSIHVVFGDGLVSSKTVSVGKVDFVKEISQELGVTFEDAYQMLTNYAQSKLSESENQVVQTALQDALRIWMSGIILLFAEFSGVKTFAPKIFLLGGGFDIPDVYELIVTEPWTKSIPFRSPPEFSRIALTDIPRIVDSTGKLSSPEWILPASLCEGFLE